MTSDISFQPEGILRQDCLRAPSESCRAWSRGASLLCPRRPWTGTWGWNTHWTLHLICGTLSSWLITWCSGSSTGRRGRRGLKGSGAGRPTKIQTRKTSRWKTEERWYLKVFSTTYYAFFLLWYYPEVHKSLTSLTCTDFLPAPPSNHRGSPPSSRWSE